MSRFLTALFLPLLALLAFLYAWLPLRAGFDVWAHAAIGGWMWTHGEVARHSLFIWGAPPVPWVWHSWLSQVLFFWLMKLGGPPALALMTQLCVLLCFSIVAWQWKKRAPLGIAGALCFATALWLSAPRFQPRQEALSAVLLALLLSFLMNWAPREILSTQQEEGHRWKVGAIAIIALFALWVNLHALVAMALVVMVLSALCDALQFRFASRTRLLLGLTALCFVATLLNPYGLDVWQSAGLLKGSSVARFVEEWKPPLLRETVNGRVITDSMPVYVVTLMGLSLVAFLAWWRSPEKRWTYVVWIMLANALFLMQRRHSWLAAILVMAAMAANASQLGAHGAWLWWRRISRQEAIAAPNGMRLLAQGGVALCLGVWCASVWPMKSRSLLALDATRRLPLGAAQFIENNHRGGRILNDYEYSSYLQWRWNGTPAARGEAIPKEGARPLYLDLMSDYPDAVLFEYLKLMQGNKRTLRILDEAAVNTVILGPHKKGDGLWRFLNRDARWQRVFSKPNDATVWMRRAPMPAPSSPYFVRTAPKGGAR